LDFALHWVRRRQRALTRAVLALFCLAWLQAAALPCAMADAKMPGMGSSAHHCPYCPPVGSSSSASQDPGACAYPHQAQADGRATAPLFVAIPASQVLHIPAEPGLSLRSPDAALPEPVARVPLSVSYCRFLE
jgi:hypothetical protein